MDVWQRVEMAKYLPAHQIVFADVPKKVFLAISARVMQKFTR
jgi:hypothetical protein